MRAHVREAQRLAATLLPFREPVVTLDDVARIGDGLLNFPDHSVATIACCDVLQQVPDVSRFVEEIKRVLAPDGLLFVTAAMNAPVHDQADYWRFTPAGLRCLLDGLGNPLILTQGPAEFPHTLVGVAGRSVSPNAWRAFSAAATTMSPSLLPAAWRPPRAPRRGWRDRIMGRRASPAPSSAADDAQPVPAASASSSGMAERSNFDAGLSRMFYEASVWRDATWLGFPIAQIPTDLMALQEVIFRARPRVILECGTNKGGGTVFLASMLRLLHGDQGRVISIDITEKPGLREQLAKTTWEQSITLLHGSSTAPEIVEQVQSLIGDHAPVLIFLDSDHSYAHVRDELRLYHPFVTPGSYLIVFDTICRYLADVRHGSPTWAEDNPLRAVQEFLPQHPEFSVEREWEKYMATFAPYGFLRRLR